jgi:hypothetical protein
MKTTLLSVFFVVFSLLLQGQWSYTNLSQGKEYMGSAAAGNKIYFAGGYNGFEYLTEVQSYDLSTGVWESIGNLSVAREIITGVSCGSMIFFAGGFDWDFSYNTVDIYNTVTQEWSVAQLSVDRFSLEAVSYGSKVLFAGGVKYPGLTYKSVVDIYDTLTGQWTTSNLSQAREAIAATVVGDLAMFAGGLSSAGPTNVVDIYNFSTNSWSRDTLSLARSHASATTVGSIVIIAGGSAGINNPTNRVDIYDVSTGIWDTASLSVPRAAFNNAATVGGKAYFAGGGKFTGGGFNDPQKTIDIYNPENDTWMTDALMEKLVKHSVLGIGNYLIIAGGTNDQGNFVSNVEIFYDPQTGITTQPEEDISITIYPNPCNNNLTINTPNIVFIDEVKIYDQTGQKVLQGKPVNNTLDISRLEKGMYIIELKTDQGKIREKLIVQ